MEILSVFAAICFYGFIFSVIIRSNAKKNKAKTIRKTAEKTRIPTPSSRQTGGRASVKPAQTKSAGRQAAEEEFQREMRPKLSQISLDLEDRSNDWLAKQLRAEKKAKTIVDEMFDLKALHKAHCGAEDIDTGSYS